MNIFKEWDQKRRFAGAAGEEYELFLKSVPHHEKLQGTVPELLRRAGVCRAGAKIVDLGCGYGHTTRLIWKAAKKAEIVAVDNEPKMLDKAEKYLAGTGIELLRAEAVGFVENLEPGSVDAFVSGYMVHNLTLPRRKALVEAAHRALKREGALLLADKIAYDDEKAHQRSLSWQLRRFAEVYGKLGRWDLVREWTTHYLDDNEPMLLFREAEARRILSEAGFVEVRFFARNKMDVVISARRG